jgi:hypothetical protein
MRLRKGYERHHGHHLKLPQDYGANSMRNRSSGKSKKAAVCHKWWQERHSSQPQEKLLFMNR